MVKHEDPFVGTMFAQLDTMHAALAASRPQANARACEVSELSHAKASAIKPKNQQ